MVDVKEREKLFDIMNKFICETLITNFNDKRISFIDKVGVDTQIIVYRANSQIEIKGMEGVRLCKMANDEIYEKCQKYPGRFFGLATVPCSEIDEAIKEIGRYVKELGFVGVMHQGTFQGEFLNDKKIFSYFC